jgi:biopolymer transport protein TolQ
MGETTIGMVALVATAYAQAAEPVGQESIFRMVTGSGPVVQSVLYILVLASVFSWAVIFYKFRQIRRARRQSERFIEIFWDTKNLTAIHGATEQLKYSSVGQVFRAGYQELVRLTRAKRQDNYGEQLTTELGGIGNVERAMKRATSQQLTELERALTFLATTASATPFIGLFGTVWGIMNAFIGLSTTHSSSIQAVAPGIAEALIATATGLAAAIPAVIAYNHFSSQIRVLAVEMENFSSEFLNIAERHFLK